MLPNHPQLQGFFTAVGVRSLYTGSLTPTWVSPFRRESGSDPEQEEAVSLIGQEGDGLDPGDGFPGHQSVVEAGILRCLVRPVRTRSRVEGAPLRTQKNQADPSFPNPGFGLFQVRCRENLIGSQDPC